MAEQRRNTSYSKSEALLQRAKNVIPNGIPGHFNPVAQVPAGTYPFYVDRAKGSRFWDVDGNEYIDYLCAYGPMILGYDNEVIEQAVRELHTCLSGDGGSGGIVCGIDPLGGLGDFC